MRIREKLTLEEKVALALELIKRERGLEEICQHYRVSHTTAYKIRNAFLEGGRSALGAERAIEERVKRLESILLHETSAPLSASAHALSTTTRVRAIKA